MGHIEEVPRPVDVVTVGQVAVGHVEDVKLEAGGDSLDRYEIFHKTDLTGGLCASNKCLDVFGMSESDKIKNLPRKRKTSPSVAEDMTPEKRKRSAPLVVRRRKSEKIENPIFSTNL